MPTHEEHLAGIEEATGRVRTLKARFNSVENDWCEAAKQLQRVHDIRQKWIDEHGSAPSDPVIQPLLQPCQKLYIRKAREYLAVSREMTALITQRDMRIWRYLAFVNRESSTEERDESGARAERERAAYRERMRQQRSARAEAENRQRREGHRQRREEEAQRQKQEEEEAQRQKQEQEEAQRQRQEEAQRQKQEQEEAQRQERARAKARARERRDAEQRQERARQEQARRQAEARQEEQTRRQRAQAQQDSRKRQREQAEQEAWQQHQQQQETRKRQKTQPQPQPPEHNTTAPTIPYGTLTTAQATLEWRTRFLATWPAPFYRTLQAFPAPPLIPCSASPCCTRTGTERILKVCDKFLRETFKTLTKDELRIQRVKWHPDRFSACPGPHREAYKGMAGEVFVVVNEVYEKKMVGGSCG